MAHHCCVPLCFSDNRKNAEKKISFHRFPKDKKLSKIWIAKIRRDVGPNFQLTPHTRVCSKHFKVEDFSKTLVGRRMLKPCSIPTIFEWADKKKTVRKGPNRKGNDERLQHDDAPQESTSRCYEGNGREQERFNGDLGGPLASDHNYCAHAISQNDMLSASQLQIKEMQNKICLLEKSKFFLQRFSSDSTSIQFYTGFKNFATLEAVFNALKPTATTMIRWSQMQRHGGQTNNLKGNVFREETLPLIDQFFLFLCRIRQGFFEQDLAVRFNISQSTVSRIIITWANFLYFMLGSLPVWSPRSLIQKNMPHCFCSTYANTRVILDATEIRVQTPSSKVLNSETYSNYKSHTTFKGLVGISPSGGVTFVSSLYTGCISDKELTKRCGVVDLLEEGDEVMADKGFIINDLLLEKKAKLVIPPFLGKKGKFTKREVSNTQEIARLRIHVERAIRRVKEFHIFDSVISLSLAGTVNQIWTVCAMLTNFKGPLF